MFFINIIFKMKIIFVSLFLFNILGCVSKFDIQPDDLPPAILSQFYEQTIEIEKINLVGEVIIDTDLPENSGIQFKKVGEDDIFYENSVKIYGIPKDVGKFYVELRGYYRGGIGGSAVKFNKKYDLEINEK